MKIHLITSALLLLFSCNAGTELKEPALAAQETAVEAPPTINIDSLNYVILPYDHAWYWIFPRNFTSTGLSEAEIAAAESILRAYLADYNKEATQRFNDINAKHPEYNFRKEAFTIAVEKYARQYLAGHSPKGRMYVYINAFCSLRGHDYWQTDLVQVMDGGNCYFQMMINLTTGEVTRFTVNGEA